MEFNDLITFGLSLDSMYLKREQKEELRDLLVANFKVFLEKKDWEPWFDANGHCIGRKAKADLSP